MEPLNSFGKFLITAGLIMVVIGVFVLFRDKLPLDKIPIGRLPGDIIIKKPGFTLYFTWVTGLVVSAVISLILYLTSK